MNAREVMEALLKGEQVGEIYSSSYVELNQGGHLTRSPGMSQDQIVYIFTHSSCCEIKRNPSQCSYILVGGSCCTKQARFQTKQDQPLCYRHLQELVGLMTEDQFKAVKPL